MRSLSVAPQPVATRPPPLAHGFARGSMRRLNARGYLLVYRYCCFCRLMSAAAAGGGVSDGDAAASGPQLLCLSLNQDQTCLACGTDSGFVIYDLEPFQQRCFRKDVPVQGQLVPMGPLRIVSMLFRSNIFALVGTAANQSFPPNKVAIWDDIESGGKTIGVVTCSSEVKSVLLRRDKV